MLKKSLIASNRPYRLCSNCETRKPQFEPSPVTLTRVKLLNVKLITGESLFDQKEPSVSAGESLFDEKELSVNALLKLYAPYLDCESVAYSKVSSLEVYFRLALRSENESHLGQLFMGR